MLTKEKSKRILVICAIATLLLSIIPALAWPPPTQKHNADAMWIEPSSVSLTTANPAHKIGYKFNVTAYLNVTTDNTFMYQIALIYNRTQLRAVRAGFTGIIPPPPFLPEPLSSEFMSGFITTKDIKIDTSFLGNGTVLVYESLTGTEKVLPPKAASLIWLEFEVRMVPPGGKILTSKIDISSYALGGYPNPGDPKRTWVKNPGGVNILDSTYDCLYTFTSGAVPTHTLTITTTPGGTTDPSPASYVYAEDTDVPVTAIPSAGYNFDHWELDGSYAGTANPKHVIMDTDHDLHAVFTAAAPTETKIRVEPAEIRDPTMVPCTTFDINITIEGVQNLCVCEFNLSYNSEVLSWIGVILLKVQGQTPKANMIADNEAGYLWFYLNYTNPITTASPVPIVQIFFHVEGFGTSPLDIHDTRLTDCSGGPIEPVTEIDGFFMSLIRDVAIINVVRSASWACQGWFVDINVTAKNLGNMSETFNVTAYYNSNLIGRINGVNLAPKAEITLTFHWNTSLALPCFNYTIKGEASTVPYEFNTSNNVYIDGKVRITFPGDINGDGVVDGSDLFIVARAFGTYPGHPDWDPRGDVNKDGVVDGSDLFPIARNYGKGCP